MRIISEIIRCRYQMLKNCSDSFDFKLVFLKNLVLAGFMFMATIVATVSANCEELKKISSQEFSILFDAKRKVWVNNTEGNDQGPPFMKEASLNKITDFCAEYGHRHGFECPFGSALFEFSDLPNTYLLFSPFEGKPGYMINIYYGSTSDGYTVQSNIGFMIEREFFMARRAPYDMWNLTIELNGSADVRLFRIRINSHSKYSTFKRKFDFNE